MSIKAKLEALIYAAEEPIGLDQMAALLKYDLLALKIEAAPSADEDPESHLGAIEVAENAGVENQAVEDPPAAWFANNAEKNPEKTTEGNILENSGGGSEAETVEDAQHSAKAAKPVPRKIDAKRSPDKSEKVVLRSLLNPILEELIAEFNKEDHGIEIRQVAGGYRMSTKPEHHDVVRGFAKSLKPPIRLSLQALETLAVIAYKQPVTVPEISEIRGVDAAGVIGTLLERKLITTAGRKSVVGRPMLYKTTKDFLVRFGLSDIGELPSIEEFEKLAAGDLQEELFSTRDAAMADATGIPGAPDEKDIESKPDNEAGNDAMDQMAADKADSPESITEPTVSSDPRHTQADEDATNQIASESTGG